MKITIISLAALLFTSMIVRAADSVVKIDKVPYTITAPGNYEVTKDFTVATDKNAISVNTAPGTYVVINLGGFSVTARSTGGTGTGVSSNDGGNIVVYNGTISGFNIGIRLSNGGKVCDLRLVGDLAGIVLAGRDILIQNCYIIGTGPSNSGTGIALGDCSDVQVSGCHISQFVQGIGSCPGVGNAFLHNYIASCTDGLVMFYNDYYQGNVTSNCGTSFSGGNAIGTENGGN
jgi:Right handed beta helix region